MDSSILNSRLINLSYSHDILQCVCDIVITQQQNQLPDLSQTTILLSQGLAASRLRYQLLKTARQGHNGKSHSALLGPHIISFDTWVTQQPLPEATSTTHIISSSSRELMLVEALLDYPHLYNNSNPWLLAANLIPLFDDLTRQHKTLPDSLDEFIDTLDKAYGLNDTSHTALGIEATLVHSLWQAMNQQQKQDNAIDEQSAYILRLQHSLETLESNQHFIIAGMFDFTPAETQWIDTLLEKEQITLVTQFSDNLFTDTSPGWVSKIEGAFTQAALEGETSEFYNSVFNHTGKDLLTRSTEFKESCSSSPVESDYHIFSAANAEQEAVAIDIQTRQWILAGRKRIAIVTENRRLARRVRALLERANVALKDSSGWALSTTSAATVIERWLECIEQNFHHQILLDFLKSPFVYPDKERAEFLSTVHRLQQGVILHENIASGLDRYKKHTQYRIKRVSDDKTDYYTGVLQLLDELQQAANIITPLLNSQYPPIEFIYALENSLSEPGVLQSLAKDAAGQIILEQLENMKLASQSVSMKMHWLDFRTWLGQTLERANFIPDNDHFQVQLLSLMQTDLQQFDGIIIAAAEQEYLPGTPTPSPFFNDSVRASLGLPTNQQLIQQQFQQFRRLLESITLVNTDSDDKLLFTFRHMDNDEEVIPSPWLEAIQAFHQLSYDSDLACLELEQLIEEDASHIKTDSRDLPETTTANPAVAVPPTLLPSTISASTYQQLMNCPYQFFAARCLQLKPPESVKEQLAKDDFGNRVHRCLEAFHTDVADVDGPFPDTISEDNKSDAISMLQRISQQIFSQDIEDNFLHRGWLTQWSAMIPLYINWQMHRNLNWKTVSAEQHISPVKANDHIQLTGILDRIDEQHGQLGIIDYKTGYVPTQAEIDNGEAVQLPYYALLANLDPDNHGSENTDNKAINRVEYLSLTNDTKKFGTQGELEGQQLNDLSTAVYARLEEMFEALHHGQQLPAWGDEKACQYCQIDGLCRKQHWQESN